MKENNNLMKEKLLRKLGYWYENSEFDKIIDKILKIPKDQRDYETSSYLVKAYNSIEKFQSAIEELEIIKDKGRKDPLWHFRLGYAYFNIDNYEDALKEYEIAHKLDENNKIIKNHFEALKINLFIGKNYLEDEINT
ncbi:tetratricopeptide repeat protein [Methanobrevibacter sp. TMH8]|uniref:tetratricopeptide repeat protein n=1 Tax=Methanobrevibacter sp. TMH8 TaxID=2848611 RepID=UPI001CCE2144|nr:tetratricopeptide repeat protein [Methanobrevibacter sp. TMH8]MBZ9570698.1 tetratricopeptide repeat protein [Methanobrevibacter sp. TMH8]